MLLWEPPGSVLLIFIVPLSSPTRVTGIKARFAAFTDYGEEPEDITLELHAVTSAALCPTRAEKPELPGAHVLSRPTRNIRTPANDIGNAYAIRGERASARDTIGPQLRPRRLPRRLRSEIQRRDATKAAGERIKNSRERLSPRESVPETLVRHRETLKTTCRVIARHSSSGFASFRACARARRATGTTGRRNEEGRVSADSP